MEKLVEKGWTQSILAMLRNRGQLTLFIVMRIHMGPQSARPIRELSFSTPILSYVYFIFGDATKTITYLGNFFAQTPQQCIFDFFFFFAGAKDRSPTSSPVLMTSFSAEELFSDIWTAVSFAPTFWSLSRSSVQNSSRPKDRPPMVDSLSDNRGEGLFV